jgi:probable rRNA maturation factor
VTARAARATALGSRLRRSARRLLGGLRLRNAELSILLVSDRQMRVLNRNWRGRDRTTDVLSFAQADGDGGAPDGLLGDVVISVDTARRQAAERGESVGREAERLLIHGLLHLLGYDHERSAAEARRMQRRERTLATWL